MRKPLVRGAGGFIAGHLLRRLDAEGYWVSAVGIKAAGVRPMSGRPLPHDTSAESRRLREGSGLGPGDPCIPAQVRREPPEDHLQHSLPAPLAAG
jgi:hypothetical protein